MAKLSCVRQDLNGLGPEGTAPASKLIAYTQDKPLAGRSRS
ncbi:hypothetical protein [Methylomonas albis]|nr:hypothetical protein [Methylomonas albis]